MMGIFQLPQAIEDPKNGGEQAYGGDREKRIGRSHYLGMKRAMRRGLRAVLSDDPHDIPSERSQVDLAIPLIIMLF